MKRFNGFPDPDHDHDPLPVTNENRDEFVRLYLEWLLNNRIAERFRAFYLGFHSVSNFFLVQLGNVGQNFGKITLIQFYTDYDWFILGLCK